MIGAWTSGKKKTGVIVCLLPRAKFDDKVWYVMTNIPHECVQSSAKFTAFHYKYNLYTMPFLLFRNSQNSVQIANWQLIGHDALLSTNFNIFDSHLHR